MRARAGCADRAAGLQATTVRGFGEAISQQEAKGTPTRAELSRTREAPTEQDKDLHS